LQWQPFEMLYAMDLISLSGVLCYEWCFLDCLGSFAFALNCFHHVALETTLLNFWAAHTLAIDFLWSTSFGLMLGTHCSFIVGGGYLEWMANQNLLSVRPIDANNKLIN
jgi:hypothetical protein